MNIVWIADRLPPVGALPALRITKDPTPMISPKAVAVAGLSALAVLGVTGSNANANPFFDNAGSLTIWSADTPGANISSPAQQGTAANPLVTNTTPVFSGTYTGAINFILPNGTDTVGSFLQTAG